MRKDRRKYKLALEAFDKGKVNKAKKILLALRSSTSDERLKVDIDSALMSCLNQVDDHELMLQVTDEGRLLSRQFDLRDAEAAFCARRAVTLLQKQVHILHRMKCIKLVPEWFEFALKRERDDYHRLDDALKAIHSDAEILIGEARELASNDAQIQFQLLFETAQIRSQMMDAFIFTHMQSKQRALKKRNMLMNRKDRRELSRRLREIESLFLRAAKVLDVGGDQTGYAHCFYNLALTYRSAWKYKKAAAYLDRAEEVASNYDLKQILCGIREVKKDLKHRDITGEDVDYRDFLKDI